MLDKEQIENWSEKSALYFLQNAYDISKKGSLHKVQQYLFTCIKILEDEHALTKNKKEKVSY